MTKFQAETELYVVAKNDNDTILHLNYLKAGNDFQTGQPIIEQFNTLEEATAYIDAIKGAGYTKENFGFLFETPEQPA